MGSLAFSPENRYLASTSVPQGELTIWDWRRGVPAFPPISVGAGHLINRLVFSPTSTSIAAISGASVRVWNLAMAAATTEYLRHPNALLWANFSEDGGTLITMDDQCRYYRWDAVSGEFLGHGVRQPRTATAKNFARRVDPARPVYLWSEGSRQIWDSAPVPHGASGERETVIVENVFSAFLAINKRGDDHYHGAISWILIPTELLAYERMADRYRHTALNSVQFG